jgi:hypothetical protein
MIEDRTLMEIWDRARVAPDSLEPEERRVDHYLNRQLSWYDSAQWDPFESLAPEPIGGIRRIEGDRA